MPHLLTVLIDSFIQVVLSFTELHCCTGIYPYDWMDNIDKMDHLSLPPKEDFYNRKDEKHITDDEYHHAQMVWTFFNCQTFNDYHELYLITDVLLLTDIFEEFRSMCVQEYHLDPAHYVSLPSMAWDAMLLKTGVALELLTGRYMYLFLLVINCSCSKGIYAYMMF